MKYATGFCRECFNQDYGLKLVSKDCVYEIYPCVCTKCNRAKNVVINLHRKARILLALGFKRAKKVKYKR